MIGDKIHCIDSFFEIHLCFSEGTCFSQKI